MKLIGRFKNYASRVSDKLGEVDQNLRKSLMEKAEFDALKIREKEREIAKRERDLNRSKAMIKEIEDRIYQVDSEHQLRWESDLAKANADLSKYENNNGILGKIAKSWYGYKKNKLEKKAIQDYQENVSPSIEYKKDLLDIERKVAKSHEDYIKSQRNEINRISKEGAIGKLSSYEADVASLRNFKLGGATVGGVAGAVGGYRMGESMTRDMDPEIDRSRIKAIKTLTTLGGGMIGAGGGMYAGKYAHKLMK